MKKWILLEKQKYFKGFGTLPDNLYMRGRTPPQELLFWSFFTPTQMLWHVRCDIAWNSLCANVTITRVIVTCELWHCLEQSLGQCHNHTPGCGMRVVTLPGTVFGPMSQSDPWLWHVSCDIAWNSLWANVTIRPLIVTCGMWHCLRESLGQCHNHTKSWLWDWPKDCSRQCHNSHVTIKLLLCIQ